MTVHDGSGLGSDPNADDPELWPVAKLKKTLKRLGRMPDPRTILEKPELIGLVQDAIANGSPFPELRFLLLLEPFRHFQNTSRVALLGPFRALNRSARFQWLVRVASEVLCTRRR